MPIRRVSPEEAHDLMEKEGYRYVDVRSIPEYQAGHPQGSYNVPLMHMGPAGMFPNPDFASVMEENFPKDAKLVVGCKSGGRSARAAAMLESMGYRNIVDQRAGYEGAYDPRGQLAEPGWRPQGLPTSAQADSDYAYEGLKAKVR